MKIFVGAPPSNLVVCVRRSESEGWIGRVRDHRAEVRSGVYHKVEGMPVENYVEQRDSGYFVTGTRISLDSIIYEFHRGRSPESILQSFPLVGSLVRVYGAITYYLEHQGELEKYLEVQNRRWAELRRRYPLPAGLKAKLDAARAEMGTSLK